MPFANPIVVVRRRVASSFDWRVTEAVAAAQPPAPEPFVLDEPTASSLGLAAGPAAVELVLARALERLATCEAAQAGHLEVVARLQEQLAVSAAALADQEREIGALLEALDRRLKALEA